VDALGVEVSASVAERLAVMDNDIELAERGCVSPHLTGGRDRATVRDIIERQGRGDVYMAVRVDAQKARLAWAMDPDNMVVQVPKTVYYERYSELFGWKRLKHLDKYNPSEYGVDPSDLPYDPDNRSTRSSSGGGGHTGDLDPENRLIKIRRLS